MKNQDLILAAVPVLSFIVVTGGLPLIARVANRCGIVAEPSPNSGRATQVPLMGGIAIIVAAVAAMGAARVLALWLMVGALGMLAIGVVDDIAALKPLQKFVSQVAIILLAVVLGPDFGLAPWPFLGAALATFWLVSTVNAFNLIDGLDGLAGGVGIIATLTVAAIALLNHERQLAFSSLAITGALAGFLIYNLHPASVFMGDSGALPLGFLLGAMAMQAGGLAAANSRLLRYAVPILILLMPLLDTVIVSVSRMATAIPVSRRGLDHSHHRLLLLGLSHRQAVVICWSVGLAAGLCAAVLATMRHAAVLAALPFVTLSFALITLFMIDLTFDANSPGAVHGQLRGFARLILNLAYKRRLAELLLDSVLISAAYLGAFLVHWNFVVDDGRIAALLATLPVPLFAAYVGFAIAGVYRGMWRYAGIADVTRFGGGAVVAGVLFLLCSLFLPIALPASVTVLFVVLLFNLLMASRFSFRAMRRALAMLAPAERVLIIGAGEVAEAAARFVSSGRNQSMRLVGFVDDDRFKLGKLVHGCRVLGDFDQLERIYKEYRFSQILIAADRLPRERLALIWAFANLHHLATARFSIRLNEIGLASEGLPVAEPPAGQVVA